MKILAPLLITFATLTGALAQDPVPPTESHSISVQHVSMKSHRDFAATIREFEQRIGVFDPTVAAALGKPNPPLEEIRSKFEAMAGSSGFMRFGDIHAFGNLLPLVGKPVGKASQYVIGNPLIAVQMIQYNPAAGLYVPLRVLIREDASGVTYLDYDLPSSLLGQFGDPRITEVARMLDQKLGTLIKAAAGD